MSFKISSFLAILAVASLIGCSTTNTSSHLSSSSQHDKTDNIATGSSASRFGRNAHDRPKKLLQLGKENFANQNYGLAENNFRQAVALESDNATAWAGLAASYDQLGLFDKADRAYNALINLKGKNAKVLNNMGYSYLLRGNYKKARKLLNDAQNKNPGLEQVQGNIHLLEKVARS